MLDGGRMFAKNEYDKSACLPWLICNVMAHKLSVVFAPVGRMFISVLWFNSISEQSY